MVHGDQTNVFLVIINYANLKKAGEFLFLQLDGSQELTSCITVHPVTTGTRLITRNGSEPTNRKRAK